MFLPSPARLPATQHWIAEHEAKRSLLQFQQALYSYDWRFNLWKWIIHDLLYSVLASRALLALLSLPFGDYGTFCYAN